MLLSQNAERFRLIYLNGMIQVGEMLADLCIVCHCRYTYLHMHIININTPLSSPYRWLCSSSGSPAPALAPAPAPWLTRALMGSGELYVLMGGPKGIHLVSSKVMVVAKKFKRQWKDLVELYKIQSCWPCFFYLWRHRKVKQGQTVLIYSSQLFAT